MDHQKWSKISFRDTMNWVFTETKQKTAYMGHKSTQPPENWYKITHIEPYPIRVSEL